MSDAPDPSPTRARLLARYQSGDVPWDAPLPPPEVLATADSLPPGRALDLGCGYGRTAIALAHRGWRVDAVDFIPLALDEARRRAAEAGVAVAFHEADVSALDFLSPPYDLAVDVGCAHALDGDRLRRYHHGLRRLLRPGARYLLYARLQDAEASADGPPGLNEEALCALFADGFALERCERGINTGGDPWPSAWFWWRRR